MDKVLSPKEIATRIGDTFMANGEWDDNGSHYRGNLANGRIASTYANDRDGMIYAMLQVPGGGGLSTSFHLFADDATDERINRFIAHMVKTHQKALNAPPLTH
ncbi:MAG: hypothetical protein H9W81_08005 [Enterococcus sp.]|nr:hypothetical protein [Enterococcus sp.]